MSKLVNSLTNKTAVANKSEAMEADTISKNGRSSKSQISRKKNIILVLAVAVLATMMTACPSGNGTGTGSTGKQSFKNKLAEGQADNEVSNYNFGAYHYAGSTHSLQSFKNRLAEGKADNEVSNYNFGAYHYAGSTHSL